MTPSYPFVSAPWSPLRKLCFRFIAAYFAMYMFYTLLRFQTIPGLTQLHRFIWPVWRSIVTFFNDTILHIRPILVEPNSSTDTSFSWASLYVILILSGAIALVWTVVDRRKQDYLVEEYWVRVATRYFVAYFALYYGIIKLFAVQMPFPSPGQLSTTLGDLSPTRLAWMFIGASTPYQVFSGVIETAAGLFLIFRRTTTLGAILSIAVFSNVVALNFAYDIPVKLMSFHFFIMSVYLLVFEGKRAIDFFMNRPTEPTNLYDVHFNGIGRYLRIGARVSFVYVAIIATFILSISTYRSQHLVVNTRPIEQGVYDVKEFNGNRPVWKDLVLYGVTGSINTTDSVFTQRYERAYFYFEVDSTNSQLKIRKEYEDTTYMMLLSYEIPSAGNLILRKDSFMVNLIKRKEPYRLARPDQFHWLQERSQ